MNRYTIYGIRLLTIIILMFSGPVFAQDSPGQNGTAEGSGNGGTSGVDDAFSGLQAPEDTLFLLPDVIVDLKDPVYEDVETLLVPRDEGEAPLSILPELGSVGAASGAQTPSAGNIAAEPADSAPFFSLEAYLGAGNNFLLDGGLTLQYADGGTSYNINASHLSNAGALFADRQPGGTGYQSRQDSLFAAYAGAGLLESLDLNALFSENGLQDALSGGRQRMNSLAADAGLRLIDTESGFHLGAGFSAGYSYRRIAVDGVVDAAASADVLSLSPGINARWELGKLALFGSADYRLSAEALTSMFNELEGNIGLEFRPSPALSLSAAWTPLISAPNTAGLAGLKGFSLKADIIPVTPWQLELSGGYANVSGASAEGAADYWTVYPFQDRGTVESLDFLESYWFGGMSLLMGIAGDFRLVSDLQLRYYDRQLVPDPWDAADPGYSLQTGWYLGGRLSGVWMFNTDTSLSISADESIIGRDYRSQPGGFIVALDYSPEDRRAAAAAADSTAAGTDRSAADSPGGKGQTRAVGLEGRAQMLVNPRSGVLVPDLSGELGLRVGSHFTFKARVQDPLALLLSNPRPVGNVHLNPLSSSGFQSEFTVIFRY